MNLIDTKKMVTNIEALKTKKELKTFKIILMARKAIKQNLPKISNLKIGQRFTRNDIL